MMSADLEFQGGPGIPIDQDEGATWPQLRDRLREIREWAEKAAGEYGDYSPHGTEVLAILYRPRETADTPRHGPQGAPYERD